MASDAARDRFAAATVVVPTSSPLLQKFLRLADHDPELTELDLAGDQEIIRWPPERQDAALSLLAGSGSLVKVGLSGLNLTDAVAPALALMLSAPGSALTVLNLERNDLREPGLLHIFDALADNRTLKELRLTGQRTAIATTVESALAELLEAGGARALTKLGLPMRNDALKRRVDSALFRNLDRQRLERANTRKDLNRTVQQPLTLPAVPPATVAAPALAVPPQPQAPLPSKVVTNEAAVARARRAAGGAAATRADGGPDGGGCGGGRSRANVPVGPYQKRKPQRPTTAGEQPQPAIEQVHAAFPAYRRPDSTPNTCADQLATAGRDAAAIAAARPPLPPPPPLPLPTPTQLSANFIQDLDSRITPRAPSSADWADGRRDGVEPSWCCGLFKWRRRRAAKASRRARITLSGSPESEALPGGSQPSQPLATPMRGRPAPGIAAVAAALTGMAPTGLAFDSPPAATKSAVASRTATRQSGSSGAPWSVLRRRERLTAKATSPNGAAASEVSPGSPTRRFRLLSPGGGGGSGNSPGASGSGGASARRQLGAGAAALLRPPQPQITAEQRAAVSIFAAFLAAKEAEEITRTFADLIRILGGSVDGNSPASDRLSGLVTSLSAVLPHRSKALLSALEARAVRPQYHAHRALDPATGGSAVPLRAVVVGAGPIGLRCAIELSLLGVTVDVLEARRSFSRLQVLHLWDWVELDLIDLGIKHIDASIFAAADFKHVSTSQLQHSLLKVALLLGVRVHFDCRVDNIRTLRSHLHATGAPVSGGASAAASVIEPPRMPLGSTTDAVGNAKRGAGDHPAAKSGKDRPLVSCGGTGPPSATASRLVNTNPLPDVLLDATGARCELFESLGFAHETVLRSARALCIVIHLHHGKTAEENRLTESTWSSQYHQAQFGALASQGVSLENIVYYRSTGNFAPHATHYFVMTTEQDALLAAGALKEAVPAGGAGPCHRSNINYARLEAYARRAVAAFVPPLESKRMVEGSLGLFDFSERRQSTRAAAIVDGAALGGSGGDGHDKRLVVARVGDALQEPFWPEGLGINRGFLQVLDCADLVQGYAALLAVARGGGGRRAGGGGRGSGGRGVGMEELEALLERREGLFAYTKRVSGHNRLTELKPCVDPASRRFCYAIDPSSRYTSLPPDLPLQPQLPPELMAKPTTSGHSMDVDEDDDGNGTFRI